LTTALEGAFREVRLQDRAQIGSDSREKGV
jgi:hypothetical protein